MRPLIALLVISIGTGGLLACKPAGSGNEAAAPVTAAPEGPAAASYPASAVPQAATPDVRFLGYANMKLGSTVEEARAAWGGELVGAPVEGSDCYYLHPKEVANSRELGFMIENGRFVRYDVGTDAQAAPGGAKVGMGSTDLGALYTNMLQAQPHKYVPGGQTLSFEGGLGVDSRLVLETDADGKVTTWRVGLPPQVDYVERCS